jgi:hypothetical protein
MGHLALEPDGTFTCQPQQDFNGEHVFTYRLQDDQGGWTTAVATVIVQSVNDAPADDQTDTETAPDSSSDDGGLPTTSSVTIRLLGQFGVFAFDKTASTVQGQPLDLILERYGTGWSEPVQLTAVSTPHRGTATIKDGNRIRYAPSATFTGRDFFAYTIVSEEGQISNARLNIEVTPASSDSSVVLGEDMVDDVTSPSECSQS